MKNRKKTIIILILAIITIAIIIIMLSFKIISSKKGIHSIFGITYIDINQECYITEGFISNSSIAAEELESKIAKSLKTKINVKVKGVINKYTENFKGTIEVEGYEIDVGAVKEFLCFEDDNEIIVTYLGMGPSIVNESTEIWLSRYNYCVYIQENEEDFKIRIKDNEQDIFYYVYSSLNE